MQDATNIQMELLMGYTGGEHLGVGANTMHLRSWFYESQFPISMDRKQMIQMCWEFMVYDN